MQPAAFSCISRAHSGWTGSGFRGSGKAGGGRCSHSPGRASYMSMKSLSLMGWIAQNAGRLVPAKYLERISQTPSRDVVSDQVNERQRGEKPEQDFEAPIALLRLLLDRLENAVSFHTLNLIGIRISHGR